MYKQFPDCQPMVKIQQSIYKVTLMNNYEHLVVMYQILKINDSQVLRNKHYNNIYILWQWRMT